VLKRSLALGADGRATILQDDLLNTYQLAHPTRRPGPRRARSAAITGAFRGITSGALRVHDHNTLDGQNGTISVAASARW
jgi:hypothetical protein